MRQDPDILLVGEIRDGETADIALRTAMTGHLVLSTLHTNDAVSSALRLVDIGVEGYMVAAAVRAIVAQRLIRKICERCKTPTEIDDHDLAWLKTAAADLDAENAVFYAGSGCSHCGRTGYMGRMGVFELLEIDGPLADALRRGATSDFARLATQQAGFRPLVGYALEMALAGETSLAEVISLSGQEEDLWEETPIVHELSASPNGDGEAHPPRLSH